MTKEIKEVVKEASLVNATQVATTPKEEAKMRQIIIETDGNKIQLVKADVAGQLELTAILNSLLNFIANQNQDKK